MFAEIVTDMKCAPRQAVGASGTAGRLGDRTATLIATRPELESRLGLAVDIGAENVGRKQIRGALHARELPASQRASARASAVLPTPGVSLDERMVLGQRRGEQSA